LKGERVRAIVVTHCHADHSPLAAWLTAETGAPTFAIGPHGEVSDDPDDVIDAEPDEPSDAEAPKEPKESVDTAFMPAVAVTDGEVFARGPGWTFEAVWTPGHTSNHLCVAWREQQALFSGDHIMGWSTTVVSPPDGDMAAYMESVRKVQGRHDAVLWPTHGNPITRPEPFLEAYLAHRLEREAQVLAQVRAGVSSIADMVAVLYAQVDQGLHRAASRSVLAHLVKLVADGVVAVDDVRPRVRSAYRAV
jgi:glyoxylase-like metal-dependent hydrolase (beta-lactamase superfamily II)